MKVCDILLILPLREEFRVLSEFLPIKSKEVHESIYYYQLDVSDFDIQAVIIGEMGPTKAGQVTEKILSYIKPKGIFLLGIAGALDRELLIGDIVVSSEINQFQAASKAIPSEDAWVFRYSGNHWKTSHFLNELIRNFEFFEKPLYDLWRTQTNELLVKIGYEPDYSRYIREYPEYRIGHLASGDVVSTSSAYSLELLGIDRKFLAIEMEAAGVAQAANSREDPIDLIVIRGISDFSDERKSEFDQIGDGQWRVYAMQSVSLFLRNLFNSEKLRDFSGTQDKETTSFNTEIRRIKRDILNEVPISQSLSECLELVRKNDMDEVANWIMNELYGYKDLSKRIRIEDLSGNPKYRRVKGEVTLQYNTIEGYLYDTIDYPYFVSQSASIIEKLINDGRDILITIDTPEDMKDIVAKYKLPIDHRFPMKVTNIKLIRLLNEIRLRLHKLLDDLENS